ncbi:MAG TPA: exodeoxyribonuclease VII large subunit, partial [Phycisphaerae bacterium]|nr:exodeoxyribonuclease VII large subunit [Phycisphaerae bacterium]
LKDSNCAIDAVMWKRDAGRCKFDPSDGLEVVVEGRVDVYDVSGRLQLYVEQMTPKGAGALELAFRQLQEKLAAEGLFDPAHKKPIPRYPRSIGVVSSPTGAAIRDISRTLRRRWPGAKVYLIGARVQGEHAAGEIARAITALDAGAKRLGIDTIIISRGGGSIEDLWPFNEAIVARAIFAASVPIISGVGHEVDVTIADLVADIRAATPTAAAEIAVPDHNEISRQVNHIFSRLARAVDTSLRQAEKSLEAIGRSAVFRDPAGPLRSALQHVDELSHRLKIALAGITTHQRRRLGPLEARLTSQHPNMQIQRCKAKIEKMATRLSWATGGLAKRASERLAELKVKLASADPAHQLQLARQRVVSAGRQLEALSYRSVLSRGFSVTRTTDGKIARTAVAVKAGEIIETELADGKLTSTVEKTNAPQQAKPKTAKKKPQTSPPGQSKLF